MGNFVNLLTMGGSATLIITILIVLAAAVFAVFMLRRKSKAPEIAQEIHYKVKPKGVQYEVPVDEQALWDTLTLDIRLAKIAKAGIAKSAANLPWNQLNEVQQEKLSGVMVAGRKDILGTGNFKCMCIRPGNILDFTNIPEPIGELYMADTSCPLSGGIDIVQELSSGEIVDYDPRQAPVVVEETPEMAWFATHWDDAKFYWSAPVPFWKSPSTWFAAGMIAVMFICGLVTLGG